MDNKAEKVRKDSRIELEYFEDMEITNPKTGEKTIQKVKVTRYKSMEEKIVGNKGVAEELELEVEVEGDFEFSWDDNDISEDN